MTDLAKLVVRLEAQTAQYMAQMEKANKRLEKFDKDASVSASRIAKSTGAAVAAAAVAFGAMALQAIDAADSMGKLAQSSGVAVESLSQLEFAAGMNDVSLDMLSTTLAKLNKNAVEAAKGSDTAKKAFDKLGVSVQNSDGSMRSTEDILLDVADRFSQLEDGAAKAALAQELFGKSGAKLIPFLNQGRAGIEALKREADALGLTITDKAAAAADAFNDNLDRLKFASKGLANQAAQQLLPTFEALSERFVKAAQDGGAMDAAVAALAVTLKALVTAGVVVKSVFENLGRAIYGNAQVIWNVVNGDFTAAGQAIKDTFTDIAANVEADVETIAKVWGDAVPKVEESAKAMDEALGETLIFNDEKAEEKARKAAESALEEIQKLEQGLRQQVETYGMGEEAVIRYRIAHGDLAETFAKAGEGSEKYKQTIIDLTAKLERLKEETEALDQMMANIDEQIKKDIERNREQVEADLEAMGEAAEEMSVFEKKAKENIQDILAQGIEDSLKGGIKRGAKGALEAFGEMLEKMAYQALAAQIADKIFGGSGSYSGPTVGGGKGGGGWLEQLGGIAMSYFGGSRDSGGRGRKGQAYMIGSGAQPEMFVPDTSGSFYPADQWMGASQKLTQNIYVTGRVDQRSARQLELEATRRQNAAASRLG